MDDTGRLINRVNALHASSPDAAERTRLEHRFAVLAQAVAEEREGQRLQELRSLRQRISSVDEELVRLRDVLTSVRRRLVAAGAAAAAENAF